MSHHLYSIITPKYGIVNVILGFHRSPDHVFCTVKQEGDERPLYSSIDDERAGSSQRDVEYYRQIFELLQLHVPESMFVEVRRDQESRADSRFLVHD